MDTSSAHTAPDKAQQWKAIETFWRGHRCRSRLEARWLCFFDFLGLKYEYEPEGFHLDGGLMYLPDLYLPEVRMWAEIKPTFWTNAEETKAVALALTTGKSVLLLDGPPGLKAYFAIVPEAIGASTVDYSPQTFSLDIHEYKKAFEEHRLWSDPYWDMPADETDCDLFFSKQYRDAVYLSRGERFGA